MNCPHPDRPIKARGLCGSCYNSWLDNRSPEIKKQKLKIRAAASQRRRDSWTPEQIAENKIVQVERRLKHRYGISKTEYDEMYAQQGGKCKLCGLEKELVVDHVHDETKRVRGLICDGCNRDVAVVDRGRTYVEKLFCYAEKK